MWLIFARIQYFTCGNTSGKYLNTDSYKQKRVEREINWEERSQRNICIGNGGMETTSWRALLLCVHTCMGMPCMCFSALRLLTASLVCACACVCMFVWFVNPVHCRHLSLVVCCSLVKSYGCCFHSYRQCHFIVCLINLNSNIHFIA